MGNTQQEFNWDEGDAETTGSAPAPSVAKRRNNPRPPSVEAVSTPAATPPQLENADPAAESNTSTAYGPGHPWHYYELGDAAAPLEVDAIPAATHAGRFIAEKLPRDSAKRETKLRELLTQERQGLKNDEARYQEIVERGAEALSRYDREIAYGGNDKLARASSLALKFNHVSMGRGRVAWLEEQLQKRGPALF